MALALKVSKVETIAGNYFVEPHIISAGEALAKAITLLHPPAKPLETVVDVVGGTSQVYGLDFIVTGNVLSWNGYGMETIISSGNRIRVNYIL